MSNIRKNFSVIFTQEFHLQNKTRQFKRFIAYEHMSAQNKYSIYLRINN